MMIARILTVFSLCMHLVVSQRPANTSICDYYAASSIGNNTAESQGLLITILVNTFVVGNYTTPNFGVKVAGIAAPGVYNGTNVELLPYFTGAYNSTNEGGSQGVTKLFLDDGGAVPVAHNQSSNGNTTSAQYLLFNHIYQYFGTLLGCSLQGGSVFPSYQGRTSMYEVHKFMDLDVFQQGFFIEQVATSAASLGFSTADATTLATTLDTLFNFRCSPKLAVPGIKADPEFQSVCIADNCPLDPKGNCSAYPDDGVALVPVNVTAASASASAGASASATGSGGGSPSATPSQVTTSAAATNAINVFQGVIGTCIFGLTVLFAVFI